MKARLMMSVIGAYSFICCKEICPSSTLARTSSTFAAAMSRCAFASRNCISDATFRVLKVCLFFRLVSARRNWASACLRCDCASARESSALFGPNSKRRSPFFTTWPTEKWMVVRRPSSLGATSASRAAATVPLYSRTLGSD